MRCHQEALASLRQTDAMITDDNLVRVPAALVEWALRQAPARCASCDRDTGDPAIALEEDNAHYGPDSDYPNYLAPRTIQPPVFACLGGVS